MLCTLWFALCFAGCQCAPHIILIIADDLGWNDVGFHGSNQIPTPNIDALFSSGLSLHNYYVAPICTPSRAALMTGKYPIHTGMQHTVLYGTEPRGLPLSEKVLPQFLETIGYKNHLVGKWHLGSYKKDYLPLGRGFHSHLGFWTGKIDMYDHTTQEAGQWGFDFRRGFEVAHDLFGKYVTDVYTEEAVRKRLKRANNANGYVNFKYIKESCVSYTIYNSRTAEAIGMGLQPFDAEFFIISEHNKSEPLFLMVGHSAVHSGNPYEPIRAPEDLTANFTWINDPQRKKFAAMLTKMDESVGKVVQSLHTHGLLQNSIILFSTDNGGAAAGFNLNAASNYPLKGVKNTLWEGGVRGAAALWSPLLEKVPRVATQWMYIADWLPTLLTAIEANISLTDFDGIDQWKALSLDLKSERTTLVHNIDDIFGSASITVDKWKLHRGTNYNGAWDNWYGPSGREGSYNVKAVLNSLAGKAIAKLGMMPTEDVILKLREASIVKCKKIDPIACEPLKAPCLFNIEEDVCEMRNLADQEPEILQKLLDELEKINRTAVPPNNKPLDPRGDPKYWGRTYTNFGDYQHPHFVC